MKGKKMLAQAITLGLLLAAPCGAWADDFHDGFDKNLVLNDKVDHDTGVVAPATDTTVDKDVSYKLILNQGKLTQNSNVSTVYVSSNGKNFDFNKNVNISLSTDLIGGGNSGAYGLTVYSGNVNFKGDTAISVDANGENGKSAYGIAAFGWTGETNLNFTGNNLKVDVTTDTARQGNPGGDPKNKYCEAAGISVYNADLITSENTKVEINIEGTSDKNTAAPIYGLLNEAGFSDFKGDTVINVTTHGSGSSKDVMAGKDIAGLAVGVKVIDGFYNTSMGNQSGHTNTLLNNAVISSTNTAAGGSAVGIQTTDFDKDNSEFAQLEINGNLNITADADNAHGIEVRNGTYAKIGSENTKDIVINAKSSNKSDLRKTNIGIWSVAGGKTDVKADNLIINANATGESFASGLHAQNNTTEETDNAKKATINVNANNIIINSTAEKEGQANGIVALSQGIMNVDGNLLVNADSVIAARGGSIININNSENNTNTTQLNGNISFDYDQNTSGTPIDATVNVKLTGANSYWNGNTQISWDAEKPIDADKLLSVNGLSVSLNNGAQWNTEMIKTDGKVGESLSGTAYTALNKLDLNGGIVNIDAEKMQGQTVEVETLTGNGGTVNFGVNDKMETGSLKVGDAADTVKVTANYTGITADDVKNAKNFKDLVEGSLMVDENSKAEFKAVVKEGLLTPEMTGITTNHETGNTLELQNIEQGKSTATMDGMRDIAATAIVAWRQEDSTLSQRLGELRESDGDQGVWVRMMRGEFEYSGAYKNQYNYFQMGYDKAYGDWHYGAALSHNDGQTAYANGSGDNRNTSLSLYGTWLGERGHYADIVLKEGRLNNEFEIHTAAGDTSGDYGAWGTSLSGEYGMKLGLDNGWYVTPQAQLTFMRIGGEDYTTSNGIEVSQDTLYSTVGRVGFELGKKVNDSGSVYAKASLLHEFAGDADTYLRLGDLTNSYSQDIGNTWYEAGFGVNYKTTENSYLYADVVKTFGDDIKTPWQWNAGMRWSF